MQNQKTVKIGNIDVANDKPFTLFAGMNVLESRDLAMQICEKYVEITDKLGSANTCPTESVPTAVITDTISLALK